MGVWVQLKVIKNITEHGVMKAYRPGDWVSVGKQTATQWILAGDAEDPAGEVGPSVAKGTGLPSSEYGLCIRGPEAGMDLRCIDRFQHDLSITYGPPAIPYLYTLIWHPDHPASERLINRGFLRILDTADMVEKWEMAACLASDSLTAANIGSPAEREKTEKVIGDLRIPIYDTALIWVRQTPTATKTISLWQEELIAGADERHAFLRSLYVTKPLICTLPPDWTKLLL